MRWAAMQAWMNDSLIMPKQNVNVFASEVFKHGHANWTKDYLLSTNLKMTSPVSYATDLHENNQEYCSKIGLPDANTRAWFSPPVPASQLMRSTSLSLIDMMNNDPKQIDEANKEQVNRFQLDLTPMTQWSAAAFGRFLVSGGGAPPDVAQHRWRTNFDLVQRRSAAPMVLWKLVQGELVIGKVVGKLVQEKLVSQISHHTVNSPTSNRKTRPR
jgi:hypothetical protein